MTAAASLPMLSREELTRCPPPGDEEGFGALSTARGNLPLVAMEVDARIGGLLAEVTLTQRFANPFEERLEATYIFPLPDRGALTRLRMEVAGRTIEGLLEERSKARATYDAAIAGGHRAAIAEEERPGVFTLRVGNLEAREVASVTLQLTVPLTYEDGEATFRFPLVVAPRYIPGRPLEGEAVGSGTALDTDAVPDASRITPPVLLPGFPNPVRLGLSVEVDPAGLTLGPLRASLHTVVVDQTEDGRQRVRLQPGERLDRDFILRFGIGGQELATSLRLVPDARGATFALTLVPPVGLASAQRPRDVAFILDRSGSMSGWKMIAARRAIGRMVDTLGARDRFTVLAFDTVVERVAGLPATGLATATDRTRFRCVEGLGRIEARGGTELHEPLAQALGALTAVAAEGPARDRILVLVTDGQVGNEDQLLRAFGSQLAGVRVFTVGVDTAVNEGFLRRLAALGGGACELLESEAQLDEAMARIHRRIALPVLEDLVLEVEGASLEPDTLVPARLPALFAGCPLIISGRLQGDVRAARIRLRARDGLALPWEQVLGAQATNLPALAVTWARGLLRELEDRYASGAHGAQAALAERIVQLSLAHGVLCRFTAFVAVDTSATVDTRAPLHAVTQAVELPQGWDGAVAIAGPPPMLKRAASAAALQPEKARRSRSLSNSLSRKEEGAVLEVLQEREAPAPDDSAPEALPATVGGSAAGVSAAAPPPPASPAPRMSAARPMRAQAPSAGAGNAEAGLPPLRLQAYRQRARELLTELARQPNMEGLRIAAVTLAILIEDLRSTAPGDGAIPTLEALLTRLRAALARTGTDVTAVREEVGRVLGEFAGGADPQAEKPAPARRGLAFWR